MPVDQVFIVLGLPGRTQGQCGPRWNQNGWVWFGSVPVHSGGEALTEGSLTIMGDYCSLEEHDNAEMHLRFGEY